MAAAPTFDALLAPADRARRWALRALGPRAAPWARDRELRVAVLGAAVVASAFAGTVIAPLWLLSVGPIALGVPHLLADVRYLWVRPGFHRRPAVWLAVGVPLVVGAVTGTAVGALVACACALAVARGGARRRLAGAAVALGLALGARHLGDRADLLFAHLHNVVAIGLWWAWRPRAGRLHWLVLALFAAGSVALLLGVAEPLARLAQLAGPAGAEPLGWHAEVLAPFAAPGLALRLVLLFAFAQSVHYGVWLRLMPEEDRPRPAPRSFASSLRALRADLGALPLVVTALLALGLAGWALVDSAAARDGYLRFAVFHGQLELAAAALLWAEGRLPGPARGGRRAEACAAEGRPA